MSVQRMGMVIGVRPEKLALYKDLHANSWPEMNAALFPAIKLSTQSYVAKYAYKDSPRTANLVSRFCTVRFNRYGPGQTMRLHHDHIHAIFDGEERGIPVLSLVGNLNDDYEGGELAFFDGSAELIGAASSFAPSAGLVTDASTRPMKMHFEE